MKHILFINPNHDTFTNPSLVTVFEQLLQNSAIRVSLLSGKQIIAAPPHLQGIKFLDFPVFSVTWSKKFWTWLPKRRVQKQLKDFCRQEQVTHLVGIDPLGLIVGGRVKKALTALELHYFSFELFFRDELGHFPYYAKIKQKEIFYSRLVDVLLIQDEERRDLLLHENRFQPGKTFFLPVSPRVGETKPGMREMWRKKLGIAPGQRVLVHSGSLDSWSGGGFLSQILEQGLPENTLLVVHSKEKLLFTNPLHARLLDLKEKGAPLLLHETLFEDYADYLGFLQLADLALALYAPDGESPYTGKNIGHIGLASGKFSCYLSQGIPVCVLASGSYEKLRGNFDFGFVLHDVEEIPRILVSLTDEILAHKKEEALRLYREILDPEQAAGLYTAYLNGN